MNEVPHGLPVMVLLRHAEREDIRAGEVGDEVSITENGRRLAFELGLILGNRLQSLHTSPVLRCRETAEALNEGTGMRLPIHLDRKLGDPGIYVVNGDLAWQNWIALGNQGVIEHMMSTDNPLPGMASPENAARSLLRHMLAVVKEINGVHLFITHDSVLAITIARLFEKPLAPSEWPEFLDAAFFWCSMGKLHVTYRWHTVRCMTAIEP